MQSMIGFQGRMHGLESPRDKVQEMKQDRGWRSSKPDALNSFCAKRRCTLNFASVAVARGERFRQPTKPPNTLSVISGNSVHGFHSNHPAAKTVSSNSIPSINS